MNYLIFPPLTLHHKTLSHDKHWLTFQSDDVTHMNIIRGFVRLEPVLNCTEYFGVEWFCELNESVQLGSLDYAEHEY